MLKIHILLGLERRFELLARGMRRNVTIKFILSVIALSHSHGSTILEFLPFQNFTSSKETDWFLRPPSQQAIYIARVICIYRLLILATLQRSPHDTFLEHIKEKCTHLLPSASLEKLFLDQVPKRSLICRVCVTLFYLIKILSRYHDSLYQVLFYSFITAPGTEHPWFRLFFNIMVLFRGHYLLYGHILSPFVDIN